jgi:hypothetical protein
MGCQATFWPEEPADVAVEELAEPDFSPPGEDDEDDESDEEDDESDDEEEDDDEDAGAEEPLRLSVR